MKKVKKVLIISPHFPPINAPDAQRVRMSLPYYLENGWEPTILAVDEQFVSGFQDELLEKSLPEYVRILKVKAFPLYFTSKVGLGSLSMRSFWHFYKRGNALLDQEKFDLIFFSTSMFHVCALGRIWKKKHGVPFIIDFQDPWRNDYYLDKLKNERPPKFLFSYSVNKKLEAWTLPTVDGLMAVSKGYLETLDQRYPEVVNVPRSVIPFGACSRDFKLSRQFARQTFLSKNTKMIQVVYVGAVTPFFLPIIKAFFTALKRSSISLASYHFYFVGTTYAVGSQAQPVLEIAKEVGIAEHVTELPTRIPYFEALAVNQEAQILFIPGSLDVDYNASKVYNCIMSGRPIFSIFNENSLVKEVIERNNAGIVVPIKQSDSFEALTAKVLEKLPAFIELHKRTSTQLSQDFYPYTAKARVVEQTSLFDKVVQEKN